MIYNVIMRINKKEFLNSGLIILCVLALKSAVFGNYMIPTGSMNPTIMEKDRIFSNNLAYGLRLPFTKIYLSQWDSPEHGDVVAFIYPIDNKTLFTKRVIGVPGDTVEIRDGAVIINKISLKRRLFKNTHLHRVYKEFLKNRSYLVQFSKSSSFSSPNVNVTVPPYHYFVMGDNRDNSADSRTWGFVPQENIVGKLGVCYFSYDDDKSALRLESLGIVK